MEKKEENISIEEVVNLLRKSEIEEGEELRLSVGTQLVLISPESKVFALRSRKRGHLSLPGETAKSEDLSFLLDSFHHIDLQKERGKEDDMRVYLRNWRYEDISNLVSSLQIANPEIFISNAKRGIIEELLKEEETIVDIEYQRDLQAILEEVFSFAYLIPHPFLYLYNSKGVTSLGIQFGVVVKTKNEELFEILNTLSEQGKGDILDSNRINELAFGSDVAIAALNS